jgi:hypothetical protein
MLTELQAGLAWGAPYMANRRFGVVAMGGIEWLSAFAGGESRSNTVSSGSAALGARAAAQLGSFALWIGADGRMRFIPPDLGAPYFLELPQFSALISCGGLLLVDDGRRRRAP